MTHVPHELAEEFPNDTDLLHDLKIGDAHFAKIVDLYHSVNRTLHRAEIGVEPMSSAAETGLRRRRMQLKDQIARILRDKR